MTTTRELAENENLREARKILDGAGPQMSGAAMGNVVLPQFVGSWQLVMDYARLRMLMAALELGRLGVAAALAAGSGTAQPAVALAPDRPMNGSGLIVP